MLTELIVPALAAIEPRCGRGSRLDLTDVVCGIIYVLHEAVRWRALPQVFGKWAGVYTRFSRWAHRGALDTPFEVVAGAHQRGKLRQPDASHIKVH